MSLHPKTKKLKMTDDEKLFSSILLSIYFSEICKNDYDREKKRKVLITLLKNGSILAEIYMAFQVLFGLLAFLVVKFLLYKLRDILERRRPKEQSLVSFKHWKHQ